ncbi:MAG: hypothetical protein O4861_19405 [Trichodesmium sp. St16_bin4-tuft]|uniref:hypothetical protein n=1 Tax=Trichodesmium erythraeum TaxID=1206 RepID=UPI00003925F5|nr:hypothetical protein [Trichodesmium erythraeum GBRTRLIN201]MCH2047890.1 hypothetical protein [Trichodesmium sp. ALOHA_ZT_67]MDE5072300.1 hypothetical protein [Trichodesmium sp. St5_bin8]MDE5091649.1 hypothetical protein [Trichodesmium sp. St18_bin3_1_1]MDE5096641.1 hypothetical protein [Trichodesmium sp. St11_bin5]MDE5100377.1 hypothetical protein [Trichodesmium sp. St16_bin4-tuft]MDE5103388.1 hypothetical protein [Trichodesmium sp. St19_bin2]MDT9341839.1 hypothetical protein [Trichodesmi
MSTFNLVSLAFPAILGIITGIGHGILAHHIDLPMSIAEQFKLSEKINSSWEK